MMKTLRSILLLALALLAIHTGHAQTLASPLENTSIGQPQNVH